jgi:CPA2 family monovalent cation:H+ antiporter-2
VENIVLFKDLAIVFAAALLLALIANRFKLPTLLAYLAVGLALGPYGLKIVKASSEVAALGEIGVALLMFAVGVEFSFQKIAAVSKVAVRGGILQIILTLLLSAGAGILSGWSLPTSIFLGGIVAISSTMLVMKLLMERGETDTLQGHIMLGILIVQDLAVVVMVAFMPLLSPTAQASEVILSRLATAAAYLILAFLVVRGVLPRLMARVAQTQSRELFNLSIVGICLAAALGSFYLGLSLALGAFLAGLILGESDYHQQISTTIAPMRDLFAMVFFVAVGMMLDLRVLFINLGEFIGLFLLIILLKPLITGWIVRAFGYSPRISFLSALGMGQIGEFSFLLANMGMTKGILSADTYSVILSAAMASLMVSPFITSIAPILYRNLTRTPFWRQRIGEDEGPDAVSEGFNFSNHVIICGHSNIYIELVKFLEQKNIPWVVLDDTRTMSECQINKNNSCVYGDPSNEALIARLNPAQARAAVVWIPDWSSAQTTVKTLRKFNSKLPIIASVSQPEAVDRILLAGANHIVVPEFEASLEVLRYLMLIVGTSLDEGQRYIEGIRLHRFHQFPHKPEQASLEEFKLHYIICGFGRLGRAVSRQLQAAGVPHVAIEADPERARRYGNLEVPILWGNAIKDKILLQAGLKRAKGLVAATDNDSVNMHIVLAARRLNPALDIVAYVGHPEAAENLKRAGANKIYSPYDLGGMRIAASIVSPTAADLMEKLIAPAAPGMEVAEIALKPDSKLVGLTLRESQIREKTGASIMGIQKADGEFEINPLPRTLLEAGSSLIIMGTASQIERVKRLAAMQ